MLIWAKSIVFSFHIVLTKGFGESLETNQAEPEPVHQVTPNYSLPREEPEKILKWREDQKLRLEQKGN